MVEQDEQMQDTLRNIKDQIIIVILAIYRLRMFLVH